MTFTTIDLFCGAGGITEGFSRAGFECLYANDINSDAVATFKQNHPRTMTDCSPIGEVDAHELRLRLGLTTGELDCLVGGPPCQGFSINAPERFLADPRNQLFTDYVRFVQEFAPKTFVFENVPGLLSLDGGRVAKQILSEFLSLGYDVRQRILFAAHYGVPQERWRLIILGSSTGEPPKHPEPRFNAVGRANFTGGRTLTFQVDELSRTCLLPQTTVAEAIGDLPAIGPGEGAEEMPYTMLPHSRFAAEMRQKSLSVKNHFAPRISKVNLARLQHIAPGGSWRDVPRELLPAGMQRARLSDHTRRYGRLRPDGLAGTVMTKIDPHWGPAFHYSQERTLTVREAARLQSFPDSYAFTGSRVAQYEQVGNAVPVLMAEAIASRIAANLP